MIAPTSPPFSTAENIAEIGCAARGRFRRGRAGGIQPLMKRRRILGFYGLENSTNQSALLTVYLFRTFLLSKPSNVHLFHPAFRSGSLHIDFPVHWLAQPSPERSGVRSARGAGAPGWGILRPGDRRAVPEKDPYTSLFLLWFPLEPAEQGLYVSFSPAFACRTRALFLPSVRRCD